MNRAIDLFAGAGGLSLGLKQAGWDVRVAVEYDATAVETHRKNMPEVVHVCDDVRDIDFGAYEGTIDLVAGGPPCQPFSVSGKQMGHLDVRDMVPEFIRAVREIRPKAFLLENVNGLTMARFRPYLDARLSELEALGYEVHWQVLNAADYGVPQKRLRLFVVGVPAGTHFNFPAPTHGPKGTNKYRTVRDALADAPADEPNRAKVVFAKNPILRKSPYAGMLLNGKGRPLNMDAPSLTIPASAGGNRTHILDPQGIIRRYHSHLMEGGAPKAGEIAGCSRLTVRQSARLQTFPDWFEFVGRKNQHYAQIGNAVPPDLAAVVARALREALDARRDVSVARSPKKKRALQSVET
ncbi:DNA cytosine methyltransferase [Burkholderia vietnamiensis]|uniref:DNA cytosine methyltransferase n=1 Tax=Burkholderia vietnamiensis TaxID=60552 RepID=UPI001CF252B7|nr:DNA cytosine methyltransferase [Burkholderia vietnamiensis]MCA8199189.1 DNA cytosine methyltransferase [Burkholderia vietnamiensis]